MKKGEEGLCEFNSIASVTRWTAVCLFVLVLCSACERREPAQIAPKIEPYSIGVSSTSFLPVLIHIAKARGYFLREGLDISLHEFPTGKDALHNVFNAKIDLATVAGVPIAMSAFERDDFLIVATIFDSDRHARAVVRKDRNINTPADLIGRKIGTTLGTTAHFYMASYFMMNGLDMDGVTTVNMKPEAMRQAIVHGDVDAVFGWEPQMSRAMEALGDNGQQLSAFVGYRTTFNLVGLKSFVVQKPRAIKKIIRALRAAELFVKANRMETIQIVADYLQVEPGDVAVLLDQYRFRVSLSQSLLVTLEDQARWVINNNLTDKTKIPDFLQYLYLQGMEDALPEAVTIIR